MFNSGEMKESITVNLKEITQEQWYLWLLAEHLWAIINDDTTLIATTTIQKGTAGLGSKLPCCLSWVPGSTQTGGKDVNSTNLIS